GSGWISRYAFFDHDYHDVLKRDLERVAAEISTRVSCEFRICVDTAPLLERSYARQAGLGWIGKNTCLINEPLGSWFFLGEILLSLDLDPDSPPPDRCGSCTRCIEACPTAAIVPSPLGGWELDARRCISYFTIELHGPVPEEFHASNGHHLFGCDICQDVCPWNSRAPVTGDDRFIPVHVSPRLEELDALTKAEFMDRFRGTPVSRTRYEGFRRNLSIARSNEQSGEPCSR
ncbi:MAG: tRNA epoxyqueuosine(34) reductase QueG, partial [Bryobacteraceae bacterium]